MDLALTALVLRPTHTKELNLQAVPAAKVLSSLLFQAVEVFSLPLG